MDPIHHDWLILAAANNRRCETLLCHLGNVPSVIDTCRWILEGPLRVAGCGLRAIVTGFRGTTSPERSLFGGGKTSIMMISRLQCPNLAIHVSRRNRLMHVRSPKLVSVLQSSESSCSTLSDSCLLMLSNLTFSIYVELEQQTMAIDSQAKYPPPGVLK